MEASERLLLRDGGQIIGEGYSIGHLGTGLRPSGDGGGLIAELGIAGEGIRETVALGRGESAALPGGGRVTLLEIFVSPDGTEQALALSVTSGTSS